MSSSPASSREPSPAPSHCSEASEVYTPPSPEIIAAYDTLMAGLLPPMEPVTVDFELESKPATGKPVPADAGSDDEGGSGLNASGLPMTKAEKQNAKKKRRKERERQLKLEIEAARAAALPPPPMPKEETIDFRLFSSAPVRPVSLSTVEDYPVTTNPRLRPLPDIVQARIRRVATEAAVEPSEIPDIGPSRRYQKPAVEFHSDAPTPLPVSFVAKRMMDEWADAENKCKALPAVDVYLPVTISAADPGSGEVVVAGDDKPERKRKRGRRRPPREFPAPRLWRAPRGLGGKSAGYAYGWGVV